MKNDNSTKIILDLCGGTGAWSRPYVEAGYDVRVITLPIHDVKTYDPPADAYGILAAPPCTMFSYARTRQKTPRDLAEGMSVVRACMDIIWKVQERPQHTSKKTTALKFWALENPFGFMRFFLGAPALTFNPYDYGDRYQKKTCIWGYFNEPKRNPVELSDAEKIKFATNSAKLHNVQKYDLFNEDGYIPDRKMAFRAIRRAVTPPGFARAFFEANQ